VSSKFDKSLTQDKPFTHEDGSTKQVPMMTIHHRFNYLNDEKLQAVGLPYGDGRLQMVVVLPIPAQPVGFREQFDDGSMKAMITRMRPVTLDLSLPRFKVKYSDSGMTAPLRDMGMPRAFETGADFSGMLEGGAFISQVIHEARMEVDEEGTVARPPPPSSCRAPRWLCRRQ